MATGGGAPPLEAVRGSKGVSAIIAVVLAIVTFLAGVGVGAFVLAPAPAPALPKLLLGTNTPFPPFEFYDESERLVGFDIELIQTLVTRAGYSYEWRDFTDFTALLLAVSAGGIDIGVAATTIRDDRNETLDFTNPYYESDQAVMKPTSDTTSYCAASECTVDELNRTDLIIGVQDITTSEFWVCDNLLAVADCYSTPENEAADNLLTYSGVTQVLQALTAGTVDIVIMDKPAVEGLVEGNPSTYALEATIETNELYGFYTADGDPSGLIPRLNNALAQVRSDGTYDALITKYFG
jgi:polar amino acid transport system substrate-binding protein